MARKIQPFLGPEKKMLGTQKCFFPRPSGWGVKMLYIYVHPPPLNFYPLPPDLFREGGKIILSRGKLFLSYLRSKL